MPFLGRGLFLGYVGVLFVQIVPETPARCPSYVVAAVGYLRISGTLYTERGVPLRCEGWVSLPVLRTVSRLIT